MGAKHLHQRRLGLMQLPPRGEEATVLVAVRVAQHHLLAAPAALEELAVDGLGKEPLHHLGRVPQVGDGLEQRHHVDRHGAPKRPHEPDLLEQHRELEQIRRAVRLRDDGVLNAARPVERVRLGRGPEDGQLRAGLLRVGDEG